MLTITFDFCVTGRFFGSYSRLVSKYVVCKKNDLSVQKWRLSLRRHYKRCGKESSKEMPEEESLEATSENRCSLCGRDMLGQTVPSMAAATKKARSPTVDSRVWQKVSDGEEAVRRNPRKWTFENYWSNTFYKLDTLHVVEPRHRSTEGKTVMKFVFVWRFCQLMLWTQSCYLLTKSRWWIPRWLPSRHMPICGRVWSLKVVLSVLHHLGLSWLSTAMSRWLVL